MIKNKLKIGLFGALIVFVSLVTASQVFAADLGFNDNTNVTINGKDYVIFSGSQATSMVVGASTLTVTTGASDTFTLGSAQQYTLNSDNTSATTTCGGDYNKIVISNAATTIITPDTSTVCSGGGGVSGGGGSSKKKTTTTTTETTPTTTTSTITVSSTAPGTNGASTIAWQQALVNAGYDPGPVDGKWGPRTAAAVRAFQSAHGLVADGWPGAKTVAAMNGTTTQTQTQTQAQTGAVSATRPGTNGTGTSAWQTALQNAGFDPGPIDGLWGPRTQAAVRAFQTAHGLTADGWPGALTTAAMNGL